MFSLANAFSLEELQAWHRRTSSLLAASGFPLACELKIDGLAVSLAYRDGVLTQGATRGDGAAGEDVPAALAAFERERRPVVEKMHAAANRSSYWYEKFPEKLALAPWDLAYDYMTRSGRIDAARLAQMAPLFMAGRP